MSYTKQVDKNHYSFENYFFSGRWMSYWYQTKEIASRPEIKSVLDIGPGTEFLREVLKIHRPDISYATVDVAEDVNPDVIGSVTKLPFSDYSYDVVCAFQVLEHIQFADVPSAIKEMARVSKRYVFVSLPHFGPSIEWHFKMPLVPRIKFSFKIPLPKKHKFNGQHYWELGKRGYSVKNFVHMATLENLKLIDAYVPFENQYHHFFILEKK